MSEMVSLVVCAILFIAVIVGFLWGIIEENGAKKALFQLGMYALVFVGIWIIVYLLGLLFVFVDTHAGQNMAIVAVVLFLITIILIAARFSVDFSSYGYSVIAGMIVLFIARFFIIAFTNAR